MTDKSEAERLADELELAWNYSHPSPSMLHAAAELRRQHDEIKRLHEVNEDLLDVLRLITTVDSYAFTVLDLKYISQAAIERVAGVTKE